MVNYRICLFVCFIGSTALGLLESFVALYFWRIFKKVKEKEKFHFQYINNIKKMFGSDVPDLLILT